MARITAITAFACSAPFASDAPAHCFRPAAHFQNLPRRGQDAVLVRIRDDEGAEGWGEAWGLPIPEAAAACVERWLAPALVGADLDTAVGRWDLLADHLARLGHAEGCGFDALSGVDIALADLQARRAGRPLRGWLDPAADDRPIRCYAAPVPLLPDADATVAAASALVAEGHRALKVKIGRGRQRDGEDLAALRRALPTVELLVDANGAYSESEAAAVARDLAGFSVDVFEDPLRDEDPEAFARLRAVAPMSIAMGEHLHTLRAYAAYIDRVDEVVVNLGRIGGFTGLRRLLDRCAGTSTRISLHGVGTALNQAATLHAAQAWCPTARFEWNVFPNDLRETVVDRLPRCQGPAYHPPEGDGLGCTVRVDALDRFACRRAG